MHAQTLKDFVKILESGICGIESVMGMIRFDGFGVSALIACIVCNGCTASSLPTHRSETSLMAITTAMELGYSEKRLEITNINGQFHLLDNQGRDALTFSLRDNKIVRVDVLLPDLFSNVVDDHMLTALRSALSSKEASEYLRREAELTMDESNDCYRFRLRGKENKAGDYLLVTVNKETGVVVNSFGR